MTEVSRLSDKDQLQKEEDEMEQESKKSCKSRRKNIEHVKNA